MTPLLFHPINLEIVRGIVSPQAYPRHFPKAVLRPESFDPLQGKEWETSLSLFTKEYESGSIRLTGSVLPAEPSNPISNVPSSFIELKNRHPCHILLPSSREKYLGGNTGSKMRADCAHITQHIGYPTEKGDDP